MTLVPRRPVRLTSFVLTAALGVLFSGLPAAQQGGAVQSVTLTPPSPVAPGTNVTITVAATAPCGAIEINYGDGAVQTLPVSTLPLAQTHVYSTAGSFTITARGQGNCSGQVSQTLQVQGAPPPPPPPPPPTSPPNVGFQESGTQIIRDLAVDSVTQTPAGLVGTLSTITYTVTVRNTGNVAVENVHLRLRLLELAWGPPATGSIGTGCAFTQADASGSAVTCAIGTVAAGATLPVQIRVKAPTMSVNSNNIAIAARVDPDNVIVETTEGNNEKTTVTMLRKFPDLNPDATLLPTAMEAGQNIIYPVRVRNTGEGLAQDVVVRATLPVRFVLVRTENSNATSCTTTNPANPLDAGIVIRCTKSTLAANEVLQFDLVARSGGGERDGALALFTLNADPDHTVQETNETNNVAGVSTRISATTDLKIQSYTVDLVGLPLPLIGGFRFPGTELMCKDEGVSRANTTVTIRIRNDGPGNSSATTLTMDYTSGFQREEFSDCGEAAHCTSQGTCVLGPAANPKKPACFNTCNIPGLLMGQEFVVVLRARRSQDNLNIGTATVDPNNLIRDVSRGNNSRTIRKDGG